MRNDVHFYIKDLLIDYKEHDDYGMNLDINAIRNLTNDNKTNDSLNRIAILMSLNRPANKYVDELSNDYGLIA